MTEATLNAALLALPPWAIYVLLCVFLGIIVAFLLGICCLLDLILLPQLRKLERRVLAEEYEIIGKLNNKEEVK